MKGQRERQCFGTGNRRKHGICEEVNLFQGNKGTCTPWKGHNNIKTLLMALRKKELNT